MKTLTTITLFLLSVTLIGCGNTKNPFGTVPVSGTVTLDGKLMEGVNINFVPVSPDNLGAYGTTAADGGFVLTTGGAEFGGGAPPGEYHVVFSKTDVERGEAVFPPPLIYLVPQRYGDPKTSGVAPVSVEKGKTNHFEFDLHSK